MIFQISKTSNLDNPEGQKLYKKFFQYLEKMCKINIKCIIIQVYQINVESKEYNNFKKAYKILHTQNYVTWLKLDMIVFKKLFLINAEKYQFTVEVLEAGIKLRDGRNYFIRELLIFQIQYERIDQGKAHKFILQAIQKDIEMQSIEVREKLRGMIFVTSENYLELKTAFCNVIAKINSVANVENKERGDLRVNIYYKQKLQKNNIELVELLIEYETQWEKVYIIFRTKKIYIINAIFLYN
ncbi:unnamed protein product [Paramecium sonneborni]|uniref:Uncharacterized protein n=1 Tax=Paramecium sonneborni TaxID=65129 RepID=A0A8S1QAK4_9CILI|nr:unnamed protein product [Paramecium sonneborni]